MNVKLTGMPELRLGLNDKVLFEATGREFVHMSVHSLSALIISGNRSKAVELEDVKFHQCVRLSRFENDRTISFIPPDGEFELMSYRLNTHVKPLIWVESVIERHSHSRVEYLIKVCGCILFYLLLAMLLVSQAKGQFKRRSTANDVEIHIPVPADADTPKHRVSGWVSELLSE